MLYSDDSDILRVVNAFESCTLPCAEWTHAAHLTVGLWYALQSSPREALRKMRDGINRYNPYCGAPTENDVPRERGYHETLTVLYIEAMYEFLLERNTAETPLYALFNTLLESRFAAKDFPLGRYSKKVLFSPEARYSYIPPDLV